MRNKYSISEFLKTVYSLVMTKVCIFQARLIRRPIYIRGRKSLIGCKNLTTGRFCRFDLEGRRKTLYIGDNCEIGDSTHIVAYNSVEIGDNVLVASKCFISDTNHGNYSGDNQDSPETVPNKRNLILGKTKIGNRVWIGENVVILSGANIGDGCIIGANAIVNKSIPKGCVVVGNNKIIKFWDQDAKEWKKVQ